uniref:Uncharacterized protein n=1 Tax=Phlebotomus papatasi TaxID=29031 RepID=A0A1B0D5M8_PHLPP
MDGDSRYLSAEEQSRELTRSIRREVAKLSEQWNNLIDRSDHWKHRLDEYMTSLLSSMLGGEKQRPRTSNVNSAWKIHQEKGKRGNGVDRRREDAVFYRLSNNS